MKAVLIRLELLLMEFGDFGGGVGELLWREGDVFDAEKSVTRHGNVVKLVV